MENIAHPRVCSFESRRRQEMAQLIHKCGGVPVIAPSLKEVPLEANEHLWKFVERLQSGEFHCLIFLTGVGTTALWELLISRISEAELTAAIQRCVTVVRGPKPQAVLRAKQIRMDHIIPEPNTWREIVTAMDAAGLTTPGTTVAIQEYGGPSTELTSALVERGVQVTSVPVYRWALPDDLDPLEAAVRATINGEFDILLWTSAQQVNHVVEVAERLGRRNDWIEAAGRCFLGSIGPVATERLHEFGLLPTMEPSHPKMGHLVKESIERWKQARQSAG